MERSTDILDPQAIAQLEPLELVARTIARGFLRGHHRSAAKGSSDVFAEHRFYAPGDDPRFLDWRAWARTDRYFVRQYEDETNLQAVLVVDASRSMAFDASGVSKLRYASCLAAAIGYLLGGQRDAVGLAIAGDDVRHWMAPKASPGHLSGLFSTLDRIEGAGETALGTSLLRVAELVRRRSIVFIFSDLIDDAGAILRGLAALGDRNCEAVVFHIMDPAELELPFRHWTVFRDPERPNVRVRLDARRLGAVYRENVARHRESLRRGCEAARIDYVWTPTDESFVETLARYLLLRPRKP